MEPSDFCPDCPVVRAGRRHLLEVLESRCWLRKAHVDEGALLPLSWYDDYDYGIVRRGVIVRRLVDRAGQSIPVDAVGSGSWFPLRREERVHATHSDLAVTSTLLCLAPGSASRHALSHAGAAEDLSHLRSYAQERVERLAACRGRTHALAKTAALIQTLGETLSPGQPRDHLPPGLSMRDCAAFLGMRRETFSRSVSQLEAEALVHRDPSGLRILDRAGLARRAAEDGIQAP